MLTSPTPPSLFTNTQDHIQDFFTTVNAILLLPFVLGSCSVGLNTSRFPTIPRASQFSRGEDWV